jgi:hypothetical protein
MGLAFEGEFGEVVDLGKKVQGKIGLPKSNLITLVLENLPKPRLEKCCQSVGAKREQEWEAGAWECIFQKMVRSEASPEHLYIYIYIKKKTCRMPN